MPEILDHCSGEPRPRRRAKLAQVEQGIRDPCHRTIRGSPAQFGRWEDTGPGTIEHSQTNTCCRPWSDPRRRRLCRKAPL